MGREGGVHGGLLARDPRAHVLREDAGAEPRGPDLDERVVRRGVLREEDGEFLAHRGGERGVHCKGGGGVRLDDDKDGDGDNDGKRVVTHGCRPPSQMTRSPSGPS